MPAPIAATTFAVPTFVAALGGAATWLLAQQIPGVEGTSYGTVVAAMSAALTAMVGLVGWMVKQLFSGNWVRTDVDNLIKQHAEATEALNKASETNTRLINLAFKGNDQ